MNVNKFYTSYCGYLLSTIFIVLMAVGSAQADDIISDDKEREPLWGTVEFGNASLDVLPKWQKVLEKISVESSTYKECDDNILNCTSPALMSWRTFVKEAKEKEFTALELLDEVNAFINQWPYTEDIYNWSQSDYWASPSEFLEYSGDCEDYSIIKYITLQHLGVAVDDLRIAVVKDTVRNIAHAVLVVYDEDGLIYVLDSLMDEALPQNVLLQYTPYYTVNEKARWVHITPIKE